MRQWSFWDWIAYGLLAIAAFGVALWKEFPKMFEQWTGYTGAIWSFIPAALVVIATVILIIRAIIGPRSKEQFVEKSELTLHIYGDDRWPTRISETNIWRYFYLRNIFI